MTWLIYVFHADASLANVPMLYLLVVTSCALTLGRGPSIAASILAFLCFDYFFTSPKYQLSVSEPAEWLALAVFLITSTIIGQLTALLKARANEAAKMQSETAALAQASWAVASEADRQLALKALLAQLAHVLALDSAAIVSRKDESGTEYNIAAQYGDTIPDVSSEALSFVMSEGKAIGLDGLQHWDKALDSTQTPVGAYIPVLLENQALGVLYFKLKENHSLTSTERQVVQSLGSHAAVILQRDKLMQAEAKAQALMEADKLKTALLSMISHDFRSPLTSIRASVSALLEEGEPIPAELQQSLLTAIEDETNRLNRMVGNVLDLSRLETGAWRPRKELCDISEIISSVLDSFQSRESARIQVTRDPAITEVTADSVQLVQVIRNLLENSLKYAPAGSTVELATYGESGKVVMEVLDRGLGLPRGEENRIFEAFYRGPKLNESAVPGVGIGLAVCKGLIEANGGAITACNREGGGAIFRVTLPLGNVTAQAINESSSH